MIFSSSSSSSLSSSSKIDENEPLPGVYVHYSYNDGFAVPKELIQNADDAGATKVCFLYDERENIDCREGLFDTGMAECQGQALWVYNDKPFQEKDFRRFAILVVNFSF
jgi:hypothetical protein